MNENINIAEILKDAPNTTKLYSPIYGKVRFDRLRTDNKTIEVSVDNAYKHFDYYGRAIWHNLSDVMFTGEECLLFPSKQNRDWSTFKVPQKQWKPGMGEMYWVVYANSDIVPYKWDNDSIDNDYFDFGNCFKTKEEAEAMAEKIKKLLKEEQL